MTYIAAGLLALVILLVAVLVRQQTDHTNRVENILARSDDTMRSLLDRIQHPTIRQVQAAPHGVYEAPRDAAEMAQVGMIVPDGISVGSDNGDEPAN